MKVEQMKNRSGRGIPNQSKLIGDDGAVYFQSYSTIIAKKQGRAVWLDIHGWNYSRTTGKYRNLFPGETRKETEKKIRTGEYRLTELN